VVDELNHAAADDAQWLQHPVDKLTDEERARGKVGKAEIRAASL